MIRPTSSVQWICVSALIDRTCTTGKKELVKSLVGVVGAMAHHLYVAEKTKIPAKALLNSCDCRHEILIARSDTVLLSWTTTSQTSRQ